MAQKKPGAETAQKLAHLADVERLASSLMDEVATTRRLRIEQAATFERVTQLASIALVTQAHFGAECIAELRAQLGAVVAMCTDAERTLRVRVAKDDSRGVEYCGPLTYIHSLPDGKGYTTSAITSTGPRSGFCLASENKTWIRGHHAPDSAQAKALVKNYGCVEALP